MQESRNLQYRQDTNSKNITLNNVSAFRTLLFICGPGTVSKAMEAAIESDFPWLSVKAVPDLRLALTEFEHPVQLVLLEFGMAHQLREYWPSFAKIHPSARLAFLSNEDTGAILPEQLDWVDPQIVRGLLGLDTNLDVFLSILRLVLRGGTYFPAGSLRQEKRPAIEDRESGGGSASFASPEPGKTACALIDKLTKREKEILALIAIGNQNKIIAAALGLSEHTVKIHIHNIITKLGMHNRTEVVALYFEKRNREASDHARGPDRSEGEHPLKTDK